MAGSMKDSSREAKPLKQFEDTLSKAQAEQELKNGETAVEHWIRSCALARIVYGGSHWRFALCHIKAAQCYFELLGLYNQALQHTAESRQIIESLPFNHRKEPDALYVLTLANLITGQVMSLQAQYPKMLSDAEKYLLSSDKLYHQYITTAQQPRNTELEINIVHALGKLYNRRKDFELAKCYLEKGLDLCRKNLSRNFRKETEILKDLADGSDFNTAVIYLTEAEKIVIKNLGEISDERVEVMLKLSKLYISIVNSSAADTSKEYATKAEEILWNSHNILVLSKGPSYYKSLIVLDELIRLMILLSRYKEAIDLLKDLIVHKCSHFGEYTNEVAKCRKLLGLLYLNTEQITKGSDQLKLAREILIQTLGHNHVRTIEISNMLEELIGSRDGRTVDFKTPLFQVTFK